jgi:hypothetical protein
LILPRRAEGSGDKQSKVTLNNLNPFDDS